MTEQRFEFGKNWKSFLATLNEQQIETAIDSVRNLLGTDSLRGSRFLDVGCGSGLFSLAAHRLGANVVSIDFDADSVDCTKELKSRYGSESPDWVIGQGSVLDQPMMESLGQADVVYAWGVLHHTGQMDRAVKLAAQRTKSGGLFCIAIYNDQGRASRRWLTIKRIYHRLPRWMRPLWVLSIAGCYETKFALSRLSRFQNPLPFADWRAKKKDRGMSAWHDWVDWIGGLPFEVANPTEIESRLAAEGFSLEKSKLIGTGWGCNEFVFRQRVNRSPMSSREASQD